MAKCIYCGEWSGFFVKAHDACAANASRFSFGPSSVQPTSALPPRIPFEPPAAVIPNPYYAQSCDLALEIAAAGLRHWRAGTETRAGQFLDGVLRCANRQIEERAFVNSSPCGITDARWVWVVMQTCGVAIALNIERGEYDHERFPYKHIDTEDCDLRHGKLKNFTARSTDEIWKLARPPFGWGCMCQVGPLMSADVANKSLANKPAAPRIQTRQHLLQQWQTNSPASAYKGYGIQ